jgi:hypothetical protein
LTRDSRRTLFGRTEYEVRRRLVARLSAAVVDESPDFRNSSRRVSRVATFWLKFLASCREAIVAALISGG